MSKLNDIQMFYKVKTGKDVYLMTPRPKDSRVLDEDAKQTEARIKKGSRGPVPWDDPYAIAAAALINSGECEGGDPTGPPWGQGDFARGTGKCTEKRDRMARSIAAKMARGKKGKKKTTTTATAPSRTRPRERAGASSLPIAAMMKAVEDLTFDQEIRSVLKKGCGCNPEPSEEDIEKVSDKLATLMSAAAGWALSGDVTRGHDDHLKREWELAHKERLERERREEERRERRRRRMKKSDDFLALNEYYFLKDHSMVPPRQGLLWDAVKHRWTRPENVGRTVTEVQGSKRFRGVGTGVHERSVGGHGSGSVRGAQRGRKFRGTTDVGQARPHESTHPSRRGLKGGKALKRQGHKKSALTVLREHRRRHKRRK